MRVLTHTHEHGCKIIGAMVGKVTGVGNWERELFVGSGREIYLRWFQLTGTADVMALGNEVNKDEVTGFTPGVYRVWKVGFFPVY